MKNPIYLSIIIPIKISEYNTFLYNRLRRFLEYFDIHHRIEFVIVDSSESLKYNTAIKACVDNVYNARYIYTTIIEPYSSARARNIGAKISKGTYLLFFDIDLLAQKSFFIDILQDVESLKLISDVAFTIYPCLYLTSTYSKYVEEKLDKYQSIELTKILELTKEECLLGKKDKVLYPAINTSTILVSKKHFLSIGGYDETFSGHGYEDFFLIHILSYYYPLAEKDSTYTLDYKTDYPGLYLGFRQYFSYYALENLFRGLYTIHIYHDRNKKRVYYTKRDINSLAFQKKINELGTSISTTKYLTYFDYQKFINNIFLVYGYNRKQTSGFYRPLLNKDIRSRAYRIFRKIRKLVTNPSQFFKDIRLRRYIH